jgi:hypothetical protein
MTLATTQQFPLGSSVPLHKAAVIGSLPQWRLEGGGKFIVYVLGMIGFGTGPIERCRRAPESMAVLFWPGSFGEVPLADPP